jgi:hypothetical protein
MEIKAGRLRRLPWLHLRERIAPRPTVVDVNVADPALLKAELGLSDDTVARIVEARQNRPLLELEDLVRAARVGRRDARLLAGRIVGASRESVVLAEAAIEGERIFSGRAWAAVLRFHAPTRGAVVLARIYVRWRGQTFLIERKVSAAESAKGVVRVAAGKAQALPSGPVELRATLYDDGGGADSRLIETWVLPSNPLALIVSPAAGSIYNGSVRPTWSDPNWVTAINLTLINGDASPVQMARPVTWEFWDGGVGGDDVEHGSFNWPQTINIPAFGQYGGWITFTSPPGSDIHDTYEDKEDMTIRIAMRTSDGRNVEATITCRIMAGWGVNIIEVGNNTASQRQAILAGINDARDVYENHGLTFTSVEWWVIPDADAGGYRDLGDDDEWDDLLDDWTVPNESVDCFVVRTMWDSYAGWSPIGGPDDKDDDDDGLAVTRSLVCMAHELGHYMGDLDHADALGTGNVMHSTCGGRNFTYDQYREFLDHEWTRIAR